LRLLYPETLEDVAALKEAVKSGLEKLARGEDSEPESLEAVETLNEIGARDQRRKRDILVRREPIALDVTEPAAVVRQTAQQFGRTMSRGRREFALMPKSGR
jgi:hypothetical protein